MKKLFATLATLSALIAACSPSKQGTSYNQSNYICHQDLTTGKGGLEKGAKPNRFFDLNEKEIGGREFAALDRSKDGFFHIEAETDSSILHILEQREFMGQIGTATLLQLRAGLEKNSGSGLDPSKSIVVIWHPGKDRCNEGGDENAQKTSTAAFLKLIRSQPDAAEFWVHKQGVEPRRQRASEVWIPDPERILERTFFYFHYPCGSFVVIRPDGKFMGYKGESAWQNVIGCLDYLRKK